MIKYSPSPNGTSHWSAMDPTLTPKRRREIVDEIVGSKDVHKIAQAIMDQTKRFTDFFNNEALLDEVGVAVEGWSEMNRFDPELILARTSGMIRYLMENGSYVADLTPLQDLQERGIQKPGMSLIDLGTGSGAVPKEWKKYGPAMGFDVSPSFVGANPDIIKFAVIDGEVITMRNKAAKLMQNPLGYTVLSSLTLDRVGNPRELINNMVSLAGKRGNFALDTLLPVKGEDDEDVGVKIVYTPPHLRITKSGTVKGEQGEVMDNIRDAYGRIHKMDVDVKVEQMHNTVQTTTGAQEYDNFYRFLVEAKKAA